MSETNLLRRLLLHAAKLGSQARLYRNNVGRMRAADGRWVQFGLCVGSSDAIGYVPVTITADMVGQQIAVFCALETKAGRGVTTTEQGAFLSTVQAHGGIAAVVRRVEDADAAVARFLHHV